MWSQTWNNIIDFTLPHPEVENEDVTEEMLKQVSFDIAQLRLLENIYIIQF